MNDNTVDFFKLRQVSMDHLSRTDSPHDYDLYMENYTNAIKNGDKDKIILLNNDNIFEANANYIYPDCTSFSYFACDVSSDIADCFPDRLKIQIIRFCIKYHYPNIENLVYWNYAYEIASLYQLADCAVIHKNLHALKILYKLNGVSLRVKLYMHNSSREIIQWVNTIYPIEKSDITACLKYGTIETLIIMSEYVDLNKSYEIGDILYYTSDNHYTMLDYIINSEFAQLIGSADVYIHYINNTRKHYVLFLHNKYTFVYPNSYKSDAFTSALNQIKHDLTKLKHLFDIRQKDQYYVHNLPIELYSIIFSYMTNITYSYKKIRELYHKYANNEQFILGVSFV